MSNSVPQDMPQYNPAYTKWCPTCRNWLPFSAFCLNRGKKDGLQGLCKECKNRRSRETSVPAIDRDRQLRINYGITSKQYDRMLEEQNGVCACCGQPETRKAAGRNARIYSDRVAPLVVDHDHAKGNVRALLCGDCNTALGNMKEDPERIKKLLAYAEWCQTLEPAEKIVQLRLVD